MLSVVLQQPGLVSTVAARTRHAPPVASASTELPSGIALAVVDLDFTLWHRPRFRRGPPWSSSADGVVAADGTALTLYPGARQALAALHAANVPVAVCSRTHRPQWALEWLRMLRVSDDDAEEGLTASDVIGAAPIVIRDGSKRTHLREICHRAGLPLDRKIVFFDDKLADCREVEELGVTAVHCEDGLTVPLLLDGARRAASDNDS
jgi:magnesium-dependent phosphatase 1